MSKMRHLILIQEDTSDDSDEGEDWNTWRNNVPAMVTDVRGMERVRGQQVQADVDVLIETRYSSQITPKMRVKHDGRTYDIKAALDKDGLKRFLVIQGAEVQ